MGLIPVGPPHIGPPEPEQEGFQAELRVLERDPRGIAGATEITDRFVLNGRDVHARQIAGPKQPRVINDN